MIFFIKVVTTGKQYKIELVDERLFKPVQEELQLGDVEFISEEEFYLHDPTVVSILDESGQCKVGSVTMENCYTGKKG